MTAQWDIKGKTVLVTGGASGMGALHVESYLKEGAKFVALLDIAEEQGKVLEAKLSKNYPGKVQFIKCDISNEANVVTAFNTVIAKVKQLDIIVNNAGIMNDSENIWATTCDVNWRGLVSFCMKGVKHMRKDEGGAGGTIINISSIASFFTVPTFPIYNGSKAAVLHFSRCLAMEPFFSTTGVRVLTMCFGATDTPLLQGIHERLVDKIYTQAIDDVLNSLPMQRPESGVAATIEIYKKGTNGSVWISQNDAPAQEITSTITKAYDLMASVIAK